MRRNSKKQIEKGRLILEQHPHLDLDLCEFNAFHNSVTDNETLFRLVMDLFHFGVAVGYRAHELEKR